MGLIAGLNEMALALLKDIPKMPLMCYDQCKGGNIMGCFYWLIVGWWLEPILFVIKAIYMLFVGFPLKIMKWCAVIAVAFVVGTLLAGSLAAALFLTAMIAIVTGLVSKK